MTRPAYHLGLFFALIVLAISSAVAAETRVWRAATGGHTIKASLLRQTDTEVVLQKDDGTEVTVLKKDLSGADRKFLKESAKADRAKPVAAAPSSEEAGQPQGGIATPADPSGTPGPAHAATSPWPSLTDPAVPDEPGTDYAALAKKMMEIPPVPKFTKRHSFKLDLPSPETAALAEGGLFLCTHDLAKQQLDVWDLNTGKIAHTWTCGPLANSRCFAISPTGKTLAVGREDHMVVTYDVASGKQIFEHNLLQRQDKKVFRVALSWQDDHVSFVGANGDLGWFPVGGGKGFSPSIGTFRTFVPWAPDDALPSLRISGKGTIGIVAHPSLSIVANFNPTEPFLTANFPKEPILAFAPISKGLVSWLGINDGYRLHQCFNEQARPTHTVLRGALCRTIAAQAAVDREEQYVWCYGRALQKPVLDIFSVDEFELPMSIAVPEPSRPLQATDREWIAPETRRLIRWCHADKELTLFELGAIEPLPSWKIHGTMHRLLLEKKYDRIDGLAAALQDQGVLPGGAHKPILTEIMEDFHEPQIYVQPWEWEQRLEAWVEERPKCDLARLALANHRICEGWAARGGGYANTVTPEGMAKFLAMGEDGHKLLAPLLKRPKPPADALFLQLRVAKMLGWDLEKQLALADQLLEVAPEHVPFHNEMVLNLLPRWFGFPGASGAYADKVAKKAGGDAGEVVYACMGFSLGTYVASKQFVDETGFDAKRISDAFLAEANRHPNDNYYRLRFYGSVMYGSRAQPDAFAEPAMEVKLMASIAQMMKSIVDLSWNPYAVNQCPILRVEFERFRRDGM